MSKHESQGQFELALVDETIGEPARKDLWHLLDKFDGADSRILNAIDANKLNGKAYWHEVEKCGCAYTFAAGSMEAAKAYKYGSGRENLQPIETYLYRDNPDFGMIRQAVVLWQRQA